MVIFICLRSLQLARIQPWCESWWRMSGQSGLSVIISTKGCWLCAVMYERILLLHCNSLASHFRVGSWASRFNFSESYQDITIPPSNYIYVPTSPVCIGINNCKRSTRYTIIKLNVKNYHFKINQSFLQHHQWFNVVRQERHHQNWHVFQTRFNSGLYGNK